MLLQLALLSLGLQDWIVLFIAAFAGGVGSMAILPSVLVGGLPCA